MALDFSTLKQMAAGIRDEIRVRMNTAVRNGALFHSVIEKIEEVSSGLSSEATTRQTTDEALQTAINSEATARQTSDEALQTAINSEAATRQTSDEALQTAINSEAATRQTDDETLQKAIDVAGPDVLVASGIQDMYEKLNDSAWWLNGQSMTGKIMVRQIRISPGTGLIFTLLVVRSEFITQYLFGPAKLNEDNTFADGEAYFESYILKRTILGSGTGQWHYIDRPDFFNIDAYKPLSSGYHTATTARSAIPSSMHKPGMVITYRTAANTWVTEQARGTSVWSQDANWIPFGTGGSGGTGDGGLQEHVNNKRVHVQNLGNNPDLNDITDVGYYFYTLMANGSPVKQNGYLQVVGSEQTGIIQLRYSVYGIDMRRQDGEEWDEWMPFGTGENGGDDLTDIKKDVFILQKNTFFHLDTEVNLDSITYPGAYYIGTQITGMIYPVPNRKILFVVGKAEDAPDYLNETHEIAQYLIDRDGIRFRKKYRVGVEGFNPPIERWDEWVPFGGVPEAPQDGKLYARKDGEWVEANDKRIVILSEEEYEDLSGGYDEDTLYFII